MTDIELTLHFPEYFRESPLALDGYTFEKVLDRAEQDWSKGGGRVYVFPFHSNHAASTCLTCRAARMCWGSFLAPFLRQTAVNF